MYQKLLTVERDSVWFGDDGKRTELKKKKRKKLNNPWMTLEECYSLVYDSPVWNGLIFVTFIFHTMRASYLLLVHRHSSRIVFFFRIALAHLEIIVN